MAWRYLPHQLNNRKFSKAVVFVHGANGSVKSWMGAPNRFVDRLSRVPAVYNHIGLYVFGYDTKIFAVGGVWGFLARIRGLTEFVRRRKLNADIKRIATELKATISEMLPGYKTIVLVGQGMGGVVIKRVLVNLEGSLKCQYIEIEDTDGPVLLVDDVDDHVAYKKLLALLQSLVSTDNGDPG